MVPVLTMIPLQTTDKPTTDPFQTPNESQIPDPKNLIQYHIQKLLVRK